MGETNLKHNVLMQNKETFWKCKELIGNNVFGGHIMKKGKDFLCYRAEWVLQFFEVPHLLSSFFSWYPSDIMWFFIEISFAYRLEVGHSWNKPRAYFRNTLLLGCYSTQNVYLFCRGTITPCNNYTYLTIILHKMFTHFVQEQLKLIIRPKENGWVFLLMLV
jgi:hypothetical protein